LRGGSSVPVVHTVELVDWALGGPLPPGMEGLEKRARGLHSRA